MDEIVLTAATGRTTGTRSSRRSRTAGHIPAVLYGLQQDPLVVSVEWPELRRAITTEAGLNAIINLEVGGERHMSIVREIQRHPVRRDVLHVDFVRVDPDQDITVDVSIVMIGEAKEVTDNDGMVDQNLFTLTVNAAPDNIPTEIQVDISALTIGDSTRVGDLLLPEGVTTDVDPDEAVAVGMITRSTLDAIAAEEAEEAAALAAELGLGEGEGEDGEPSEETEGASTEDSGDSESE